MSLRIVNLSNDRIVAANAAVARNFWQRFRGLMLRRRIDADKALIFYHTGSIHTFFMLFKLDLVFLDRQMKVKKIVRDLAPWRMVFSPGAYAVIEMAGGVVGDSLNIGDLIEIK